jgi:DNA polymerase-4
MASIDEAYLDMTGSRRLLGPPLAAAHSLHQAMKSDTGLNCSIGIATSRLVAKITSDQAKPNGVLWVLPGEEARFLAPLEVRKIPGVGKVTEKNLHQLGIRKIGDLAALDQEFLESKLGKWGLALAGKALGLDAGGWFDSAFGESEDPKSISHEHTYSEDTADADRLEATLAKLSEMVGRRLREHGLHARTVQLKLRYQDFSTITRAHSLDHSTQLDHELFNTARDLFRRNWKPGAKVRLLGVQASGLSGIEGQLNLLDDTKTVKWRDALRAMDGLRDRYGESAVSLANGIPGAFRERTHESLVQRQVKKPKGKSQK